MSRYLVEWFLNGQLQKHRTLLVDIDTLYNMTTTKGLEALLYLHTNNDCVGVYVKCGKIIGCSEKDTMYQKITDLLKVHSYECWLSKYYPNVYYQYLYRNRRNCLYTIS